MNKEGPRPEDYNRENQQLSFEPEDGGRLARIEQSAQSGAVSAAAAAAAASSATTSTTAPTTSGTRVTTTTSNSAIKASTTHAPDQSSSVRPDNVEQRPPEAAAASDDVDETDASFVPTQEESRLLRRLLRNYDRRVRPVVNASTPVIIHVGITLTQIFDMVRGTP